MKILIFQMVVTILFFSGCGEHYIVTKQAHLQTLTVSQNKAETEPLNIKYKVITK